MKHIIAFLFLLLPFVGFTQCPTLLGITIEGDSLLVPYSDIDMIYPSGDGTWVNISNPDRSCLADQSYEEITAGCGCFCELTTMMLGTISVSIENIDEIGQDDNGQTYVLVEQNGLIQRLVVTESLSELFDKLTSCEGGGGGPGGVDTDDQQLSVSLLDNGNCEVCIDDGNCIEIVAKTLIPSVRNDSLVLTYPDGTEFVYAAPAPTDLCDYGPMDVCITGSGCNGDIYEIVVYGADGGSLSGTEPDGSAINIPTVNGDPRTYSGFTFDMPRHNGKWVFELTDANGCTEVITQWVDVEDCTPDVAVDPCEDFPYIESVTSITDTNLVTEQICWITTQTICDGTTKSDTCCVDLDIDPILVEIGEVFELESNCEYQTFDISTNDAANCLDDNGNFVGIYVVDSIVVTELGVTSNSPPSEIVYTVGANGLVNYQFIDCPPNAFSLSLFTHYICDGVSSNTAEDIWTYVPPPIGSIRNTNQFNTETASTGDLVIKQIVVCNAVDATGPITDITLTDYYDSSLTYVSNDGGNGIGGAITVTGTIPNLVYTFAGPLQAGECNEVDVVFEVTAADGWEFATNTTVATANDGVNGPNSTVDSDIDVLNELEEAIGRITSTEVIGSPGLFELTPELLKEPSGTPIGCGEPYILKYVDKCTNTLISEVEGTTCSNDYQWTGNGLFDLTTYMNGNVGDGLVYNLDKKAAAQANGLDMENACDWTISIVIGGSNSLATSTNCPIPSANEDNFTDICKYITFSFENATLASLIITNGGIGGINTYNTSGTIVTTSGSGGNSQGSANNQAGFIATNSPCPGVLIPSQSNQDWNICEINGVTVTYPIVNTSPANALVAAEITTTLLGSGHWDYFDSFSNNDPFYVQCVDRISNFTTVLFKSCDGVEDDFLTQLKMCSDIGNEWTYEPIRTPQYDF